ncbi:alpha/beta fold hydrolase [Kribbella antibiotica]|uniref:Alpha/beta fold hydrolase n=1 Tax=Kribbella antibiotica TaxID=190195 RepID=A0A4R4ZRJ8_9ACTN|nr:alpha/beta fold hydrolase [Kribbella antibiotica]TDD59612.1 alpha/beta fold hydrolase [Kribbella antibiotica]
MRRQPRLARVVGLTAGLTMAAGSLVVVPASAAPEQALARYYHQVVTWAACDPGTAPPGYPQDVWEKEWAGLDCATVVVPINYSKPSDGNLSVAVSRLKAADPAKRQGVLLLNPGGPGGEGLVMPVWMKRAKIAGAFDLIGFDPRGVGRSTPLRCEVPPNEALFETRPTNKQIAQIAADAEAQEEGCAAAGGGIRKYISTMNTARDMDVIRGVLAEKKINFFGYSYGTLLGATYGAMFPSKLNRSVLDSSMHPDWLWYEQAKQVSVAAKENFEVLAAWMAERDSRYHLGKTPAEVTAYLDGIRAKVAKRPVDWPDAPPGSAQIDGPYFDFILGSSGYRPQWDVSAQLIGQIRDAANAPAGKAKLSSDASKALKILYGKIKETYQGVFQAVSCEVPWSKEPKGYEQQMRLFRTKYPYGPGAMQAAQTNCSFAKWKPQEKFLDLKRNGYPVGLVIGAEFDPSTQYDGSPAMASLLNDNLISVKDEGSHGQYGGNPCATQKIDDYLINGILPGSRVECDGAPRPDVPADGTAAAKTVKPAGASLAAQAAAINALKGPLNR